MMVSGEASASAYASSPTQTQMQTQMRLSDSARQHLHSLAQLASVLGLASEPEPSSPATSTILPARLSTASYLTSLSDIAVQDLDLQAHQASTLTPILNTLRSWTSLATAQHNHLQVFLTSLSSGALIEEDTMEEWESTTRMLEEKGKEYKQRLESVNEVLGEDMDLGVFKDVDELESVVGGLEKEIGDKERDLKGFLDLPSDITLANIKVEEKRQELRALIRHKNELLQRMVG